MRPKTSGSNKKYLLPKDLARITGYSERTVRKYCKAGKIPEAIRTRGGHWRIRRPLSGQTLRLHLKKVWDVEGSNEMEGEFEPDVAAILMSAQLRGKELGKLHDEEVADEDSVSQEFGSAMAQIDDLITKRVNDLESVSDLHLLGWVNQYWLEKQSCPTVAEVAELMGISRTEFYRRKHSYKKIEKAYRVACGTGSDPFIESSKDPIGRKPNGYKRRRTTGFR